MSGTLEIHIDGACLRNPGPAAIGVVIRKGGNTVTEIARSIGEGTNNIAEYSALIAALKEAQSLKEEYLKIFTDSELLYKQIRGLYKMKSDNLKKLFEEANTLAKTFKKVEIIWVPREENKDADKLASDVLKKEQAKVVASSFQ
jgi:ribonuclease HI